MCQLTFVNLKNNELNSKMELLLASIGSFQHKDGWGVVATGGNNIKCEFPAYYTTNFGKVLKERATKNLPMMGHIRFASPAVPVTRENAHPFTKDNFYFMHNGKLDPKKPKDFITEREVTEEKVDEKTRVKTITHLKVKISDSQIFFDEFMKQMGADKRPLTDGKFVEILNSTMELFEGKFAFLFHETKTQKFYIARGKTAELHISYLKDSGKKDAKILGYVINTDDELLDRCGILLSNLNQLAGGSQLYFSPSELLSDETVFIAEEFGVTAIGKIKENTAYSYSYYAPNRQWAGWSDDDDTVAGIISTPRTPGEMEKVASGIFTFMKEFGLSILDIQNLFMAIYGLSLLEVTDEILRHFNRKVMPKLYSLSLKGFRKRISRASNGWIPINVYMDGGFEYPWMLNSKDNIAKFANALEKTFKE